MSIENRQFIQAKKGYPHRQKLYKTCSINLQARKYPKAAQRQLWGIAYSLLFGGL